MFRSSNFDKLLDKATSNLRLEPDWPAILQICDMIRQNDCTPKVAVASIKKKLFSPNPHQAMFALLTLESIVKNCGSGVHDEVASKAFCESLRDLVKTTQHENVRNKTLELVQAWAFAFRNSTKYTPVQDIVNILKAESFKFPPLKESDAMFSADTAPEWEDGEVCHRCRTGFTLLVRQHHCRACGKVFCQQCSSKTSTLPKFGIEKEVRVCDGCYEKACRPPSTSAKLEINDASDFGSTPTQSKKIPDFLKKARISRSRTKWPNINNLKQLRSHSVGRKLLVANADNQMVWPNKECQKKPGKTAEELQEEEELQLALALSQSEAEQKEKDRRSRSQITPSTLSQVTATQSVNNSPDHNVSANSELSRYLDRGYWEQRQTTTSASAMPTAPVVSQTPSSPVEDFTKVTGKTPEEEAEDKEIDEFVSTLKSQVEIFVNRMKSDSSRGRPIANDTAVQSLFMNITAMHSRLLRYIQQQDDKRVYLESLQDKVTQIRDSRAALDTLRAEHSARLAAAAEAMERQRQMQMAAKLQAMRNKKHEYLQYQRQLALQRVQEQEREMQIRQEQQKHQYMMASNPGYYNAPGVSLPQFQPGYPTQHMYANPQMMPQTSEATSAIPNQPQGSQPMPMNQPMPQTNHPFPMGPVAGLPNNQAMMQQNIRPNAMAMQPQMMMQQMHQIRMANQSQQNGHKPQANPMMPPMSIPQQNMPPQINPNQMMGMQMPNMRMPMMQNNMQNPQATTGFNMANQPMMSNVQAPNHIPMQGQTLAQGQPITGQMQSVNMPTNVATSQTIPSNPQSSSQQQQNNTPQPVQMNNQVLRANQMNMQPQQMIQQGQTPQQFVTQPIPNHSQGQHIPGMNNFVNQPQQKLPNQMANQPQQVPSQMPQQVAGQQMQMTGQQMAQIPMQMPMQQQLPGQAVPQIGPQGQPIIQGQQIKVQAPQPNAPQQQQPPAQVKSENNNNTAELISFD